MKNLGQIQIGGSLDITNNKHVEELLEEALNGIEIPEDTNTTYTLTQDGLTIQLVDDNGQAVSEIVLPTLEDTNTTYTLTNDGTTIQLIDDSGTPSTVDLTPLLPEDTNTTYSLTQDGTIIKLVDGEGGTASEVDLAPLLPEDEGGGDPYQEEKDFVIPPANLFDMIRTNDYEEFDITSEFDASFNRITIYLHLYRKGIVRNFTLANYMKNGYTYYSESGGAMGSINLIEVYKDGEDIQMVGVDETIRLNNAKIQLTEDSPLPEDSPLRRYGGLVLFTEWGTTTFFHITSSTDRTESDTATLGGTLEEHLQRIYELTHG